MRILVVDDNAADVLILSTMLTKLGHQIVSASSGQQALDLIVEEAIDLVIMDEEMPGYQGHEVVQLIRERTDEWLPIIFISGNDQPEAIMRGIASGGDDYLKKPVNINVLEAKMLAVSRLNDMRHELLVLNKELKKANAKLEDLALHDALTGLKNRRALMQDFEDAVQWCRRHHSDISIMMIDVDWFKKFNDCYGHQAGDACLSEVAKRIESASKRATDTVARYGGEEFCVLLPSTNATQAAVVADAVNAAMHDAPLAHIESDFGHVTLSIGISAASADHADIDILLAQADEALYDAKQAGRNQAVVYYPDLHLDE